MEEDSSYLLYRLFGEKRLERLVLLCSDIEEALVLYAWELKLGQALLKPIGITEVFMRNALDRAISDWWSDQGLPGNWTDPSAPISLVEPFAHRAEWRNRAASNLGTSIDLLTHDDVIAHTSFGSWRNMIGNPAAIGSAAPLDQVRRESWEAARSRDAQCALLWREVTHTAFECIPETKKERGKLSPRAYIGARLSRISGIRNRVCHWDNLLDMKVQDRYDDMKKVVGAVSEQALEWMSDQCDEEISTVILAKPSIPISQ